MSSNDIIADALLKIKHYSDLGRKEVELYPVSNLLINVLDLLNKNGYLGSFEVKETTRGRKILLNLLSKINNIGVIKPRFPVSHKVEGQFEVYERRYLLAKDFGLLILSTNEGVMSHVDAKNKKIGGRLIAYCY